MSLQRSLPLFDYREPRKTMDSSDLEPEAKTAPFDAFDKEESEKNKQEGMKQAADKKPSMVEVARTTARMLAKSAPNGITMDDVMMQLVADGYSVHCLGNAAGSVFKHKDFESTGRTRKSIRKHAHSNRLTVWKLKT